MLSTIAGTGAKGNTGDGGLATAATLNRPTALCFDSDGNIIFSDNGNQRIRKITLSTGVIAAFAGTGAQGNLGDGGQATAAQLSNPTGVAIDAQGNVFIADAGNHKIRKVDGTTKTISTYAGTGSSTFNGDGLAATATNLSDPGVLAVGANALYFVEGGTARIRRVDRQSGIVTTIVGSYNGNSFSEGMTADQFSAVLSGGLAFTGRGDLLFSRANLVISDELSTNKLYSIAGVAMQSGYSGDGGPSHEATLRRAAGITIDPDGNILFTDVLNNTIRKVTVAQSITFNSFDTHTFGDQPFTIEASVTSGLELTFTSSDPAIASVSGKTITIHKAGVVDISAKQMGSAVFVPSDLVTQQLVVNKAVPALAITSIDHSPKNTTIALTSSKGNSTGIVTYTVTNQTGEATLTDNILALSSTGTVKVTASITADDNYAAATTDQIITIGKPLSTIIIPTNGNAGTIVNVALLGAELSTGEVTHEVENMSGTASFSGSNLTLISAGLVRLKVTVAGDANFDDTSVTGIFEIHQKDGSSFTSGMRVLGTSSGGSYNNGLLYTTSASLDDYNKLKEFPAVDDGMPLSQQELTRGADGKLYGVVGFGPSGFGSIIRFDPSTNEYTILYQMQENLGGCKGLLLASNERFYGVAGVGMNNGILFEYDYNTGSFQKKVMFTQDTGFHPIGIPAEVNGDIVVFTETGGPTSQGTIFLYNLSTGITKYCSAAGVGRLNASPTVANGKVYTSTSSYIIEYDPVTNVVVPKVNLNDLLAFSQNGGMTLAPNGKLYGAYLNGGSSFEGTIVEYQPGATTATRKFDFRDTDTSGVGWYPVAALTVGTNGNIYGTTTQGGANGVGTVFEYVPGGTSVTVRRNLDTAIPRPTGAMELLPDGLLYGMVGYGGGKNGTGAIYSFNTATSELTVIRDFLDAPSGHFPSSLAYRDHRVYGIGEGGVGNNGVLFEYDLRSSTYRKVVDFKKAITGFNDIVAHPNGLLYLLGNSSGNNNRGQIVSFNPKNNEFTSEHQFVEQPETEGAFPRDMVLADNGLLYGIVFFGGVNFDGAIFQYNPSTNTYSREFDFNRPESASGPQTLIYASDKLLYGTTSAGGDPIYSTGVVFRYDPGKHEYTTLLAMKDLGLNTYLRSNIAFYDRILYAVAEDISSATKFLFSIDLRTNTHKRLVNLPASVYTKSLKASPSGKIWLATSGTTNLYPALREYDPATNELTTKVEFKGPNGLGFNAPLLLLKNDQTITFPEIGDKASDFGTFELNAISSSGLPVRYVSLNPSVATIDGNKLTVVAKGVAQIAALQDGNSVFNPADSVLTVIRVKNRQTITFDQIAPRTIGTEPFSLTATSSSGLPVDFSTTSGNILLSGSAVTLKSAGRTRITANQAGNDEFLPAPNIEQTFCINPAKPSITIQTGATLALISSGADNTQQWFYNGTEITGATGKIFLATQDGKYSVRETVDGCSSELSEESDVVVNGLEDPANHISIYPNPVKNELSVDIGLPGKSTIEINDAMGRIIESRDVRGGVENFNLSSFARGTYIVRIKTSQGVVNKVFIKPE
jgi:uncharacterized repeat protein (TIGR03803 family)